MASAYLFDLAGTLFTDDGPVPGAPEAVATLRRRGIPFRMVTNTTSRSRAMLVERLRGYGFAVSADELVTAPLAGAAAARAAGYRTAAAFVPAPALDDLTALTLVHGGRPDVVIVGDLGEGWTYGLLQEAFEYLVAGAALIALSRDRYWLREGRLVLDAGPFVAALEYATGKQATVAGKPSAAFYAAAVRSLGFEGREGEVAMIGDDLWSDVEGAQRAGLEGWAVRTGKFRDEISQESGIVPDRILATVGELG